MTEPHIGTAGPTAAGPPPVSTLLAVVDQIRRLHAPTVVCRGCCSPDCAGVCQWAEDYDHEMLTVCTACCLDPADGKQTDACIHDHEHGAEYSPAAICPTNAILDQAR